MSLDVTGDLPGTCTPLWWQTAKYRSARLQGYRTVVANLDNTRLIAAAALVRPVGAIAGDRWPEFCRAMAKVMGC